MIFRRIKAHIEKENWFAVFIDFCIVVVGVFVGIQVANWNNASQERLNEAQYLERFADDIQQTIVHIQTERDFSQDSIEIMENFSTLLFAENSSNDVLISATSDYLSKGAFFAKFWPNRSTFDDLIATGNFDIIQDEEIRTNLMRLHSLYSNAENTIQSNVEWVQRGEDRIYYAFDAFRFDPRTRILFDDVSIERLAEDVRENRDLLRRNASYHYWVKARSIELYDEIEPQAQSVLKLIRQEQIRKGKPSR